jgi:hypothetical protein
MKDNKKSASEAGVGRLAADALKSSILLGEIREHSAKSICLYKQLLKSGLSKNEAKTELRTALDQFLEDSQKEDV